MWRCGLFCPFPGGRARDIELSRERSHSTGLNSVDKQSRVLRVIVAAALVSFSHAAMPWERARPLGSAGTRGGYRLLDGSDMEDTGAQEAEHTSEFFLFGFPVTLEHMLVIAIVIWGIIGALISYYWNYLRNRREKAERVRLDAEYSKHETSSDVSESIGGRQGQGQLSSLADARTPPRSIRMQVVLPKRAAKATAVTDVEEEEDDLL